MIKQIINARAIYRYSIILLMGFSSGLPLALVASTLQAWLTTAGINFILIGWFTLIQQPYTYKFLWSPFIDRFFLPWLDRRRDWIILMQLLISLALVAVSFSNPKHQLIMMASSALLVAMFSATQDIAIDAYRTELLTARETGLGSAIMIMGYRLAMMVSGAFALIIAAHYGFQIAYLAMAACMIIGVITTLIAPKLVNKPQPERLLSYFIQPMTEFIQRPCALLLILFILFYKLGDATTLSFVTPFLIRQLHFSLTIVATINKMAGLIATFIGGLLGGIMMTRITVYQALMIFGILQTLSNLGFMLLAMMGKNTLIMTVVVITEHLCGGLATVAFVALLMILSDHRYTATQFALFSTLASIGRVFVGPIAGALLEHISFTTFYFYSFVIGLPGLIMLYYLRSVIGEYDAKCNKKLE